MENREKIRMTAKQIYDTLLNDEKIKDLNGQIKFTLGKVDIIVKQRDVVGNIMQEWLQGWFEKNNIEYKPNPNSQMPPDFFLSDDETKDLLEVKAFNHKATPGFDIADFNAYSEEIIKKPYMLDVDYLIFAYDMSDNGIVTIKNMWLKKVWQLTRRMENWPLNLQIKDNVVHKIRPGVWYSEKSDSLDYPIFNSLEDFISAVEQTVYQNPKTRERSGTWKSRFLRSYKAFFNIDLKIPRWDEISNQYDMKFKKKVEKARLDCEKKENQIVKKEDLLNMLREKFEKLLKTADTNVIERESEKIKKKEEELKILYEQLEKSKAVWESLQ